MGRFFLLSLKRSSIGSSTIGKKNDLKRMNEIL